MDETLIRLSRFFPADIEKPIALNGHLSKRGSLYRDKT